MGERLFAQTIAFTSRQVCLIIRQHNVPRPDQRSRRSGRRAPGLRARRSSRPRDVPVQIRATTPSKSSPGCYRRSTEMYIFNDITWPFGCPRLEKNCVIHGWTFICTISSCQVKQVCLIIRQCTSIDAVRQGVTPNVRCLSLLSLCLNVGVAWLSSTPTLNAQRTSIDDTGSKHSASLACLTAVFQS